MTRAIIGIQFLLFFLSSTFAIAQELNSKPELKKWAIKLSPQHFVANTMKLEVEKVISNQKSSVIVSPFFVATDMFGQHKNDEIWGVGGELMGRLYFAKNNKNLKGFYSSFGLQYHYYNLHAKYDGWKEHEEEGLIYLKYGKINKTMEINKVGVLLLLGYQLNINNTLVMDFYQGFGIKQSFSPNGEEALDRYDYNFMDYGYSGLDFRIGAKIGLVL